jgi:hypothetical protein
MVPWDPTTNTIIQENINTTIVLSAVSKWESVSSTPIFTRIAVIPAKNEEPTAYSSHIWFSSHFLFLIFLLSYRTVTSDSGTLEVKQRQLIGFRQVGQYAQFHHIVNDRLAGFGTLPEVVP